MHTGSISDDHWAGFQYNFVCYKEMILMKQKISIHFINNCSKPYSAHFLNSIQVFFEVNVA